MSLDFIALQALVDDAPFHRWLGIRVLSSDASGVALAADWRPEFSGHSVRDYVHGGILTSLMDLAGFYAVAAVHGTPRATAALSIRFHRPVLAAALRVSARALERGPKNCTAEAQIWRVDGKLAASSEGDYSLS